MTTRTQRTLLSSFIGVTILSSLAIGLIPAFQKEHGRYLTCRLFPNAIVAENKAWTDACPLRPHDRIVAYRARNGSWQKVSDVQGLHQAVQSRVSPLEVEIDRAGKIEQAWVPTYAPTRAEVAGPAVAAAVVGFILGSIAIALIWTSSSPAVPAVAMYFMCSATALSWTLAGYQRAPHMYVFAAMGGLLWAPAIAHLVLVFPSRLAIVTRAPWLTVLPYVVQASIFLGGRILPIAPEATWLFHKRALYPTTIGLGVLCLVRCILAARSAAPIVQRTRAKAMIVGFTGATAFASSAWLGLLEHVPVGRQAMMQAGFLLSPLSLGYAVARHQLFDIAIDVRRILAKGLYLTTVATVVSSASLVAESMFGSRIPLGHVGALFSAVFAALFLVELVRTRLLGRVDSWTTSRWAHRLAEEEHEFTRTVAQLTDPHTCAAGLADSARRGLDAAGVAVVLCRGDDVDIAHVSGTLPAIDHRELHECVRQAESLVDVAHLLREDLEFPPAIRALQAVGIEAVAPLRTSEGDLVGLLLARARPSESPCTSLHLDFLRRVASQAAIAVHNSRLAEDLLASERFAVIGRMQATLAHDLRKPLGVLEVLAARLPSRMEDRDAAARDAAGIAELAATLRGLLRDVLARAKGGPDPEPGTTTVDTIISRALLAVSPDRDAGCVSIQTAPELPSVRSGGSRLVRAIANVLDNALLAGGPHDVVRVHASASGGLVTIEITDQGPGMDAATVRDALTPFSSTRTEPAGSGLGLASSRDIIEAMGGGLHISSAPGHGTRVVLEVPVRETND